MSTQAELWRELFEKRIQSLEKSNTHSEVIKHNVNLMQTHLDASYLDDQDFADSEFALLKQINANLEKFNVMMSDRDFVVSVCDSGISRYTTISQETIDTILS